MDYPTIYTKLAAWASSLVPDATWVRAGGQLPWGEVVGEIEVTAERTVGQDFEDWTYRSAPDDDLVGHSEGSRQLVVEFRIRSIEQEPPTSTAQHLLGLLRVRSARSSSREILKSAALAVSEMAPLRVVEATDDNGHTLSVAMLEVTFNGYALDEDDSGSGYFEKTQVSSTLNGAPSGAEWTDEEIP